MRSIFFVELDEAKPPERAKRTREKQPTHLSILFFFFFMYLVVSCFKFSFLFFSIYLLSYNFSLFFFFFFEKGEAKRKAEKSAFARAGQNISLQFTKKTLRGLANKGNPRRCKKSAYNKVVISIVYKAVRRKYNRYRWRIA